MKYILVSLFFGVYLISILVGAMPHVHHSDSGEVVKAPMEYEHNHADTDDTMSLHAIVDFFENFARTYSHKLDQHNAAELKSVRLLLKIYDLKGIVGPIVGSLCYERQSTGLIGYKNNDFLSAGSVLYCLLRGPPFLFDI